VERLPSLSEQRPGAPHTDLSGPFDTIVIETVVQSVDEYFRYICKNRYPKQCDDTCQVSW
jgi:hypothetical protein